MKIIISPAKKMRSVTDVLPAKSLPTMVEKTKEILNQLKKLSVGELQKIYKANDNITEENYERIHTMNIEKGESLAILSYVGLQYSHMAPMVFEYDSFDFLQEHLRILSGFYGVVKPFDGIECYRLEMATKLKVGNAKNLYEFWGQDIYNEITSEDKQILNLASKEYSDVVTKHKTSDTTIVTVDFYEEYKGQLKKKGAYLKMARGEMVKYLAENKVKDFEGVKKFNRLGYTFSSNSTEDKYIFIKKGESNVREKQ